MTHLVISYPKLNEFVSVLVKIELNKIEFVSVQAKISESRIFLIDRISLHFTDFFEIVFHLPRSHHPASSLVLRTTSWKFCSSKIWFCLLDEISPAAISAAATTIKLVLEGSGWMRLALMPVYSFNHLLGISFHYRKWRFVSSGVSPTSHFWPLFSCTFPFPLQNWGWAIPDQYFPSFSFFCVADAMLHNPSIMFSLDFRAVCGQGH